MFIIPFGTDLNEFLNKNGLRGLTLNQPEATLQDQILNQVLVPSIRWRRKIITRLLNFLYKFKKLKVSLPVLRLLPQPMYFFQGLIHPYAGLTAS
jgi:hypothetical protein